VDRNLDDTFAVQHDVLTRRQATDSGVTRSDLRYLLRGNAWCRQRRGIYARASEDDQAVALLRRILVARLALDGKGVASHETAAKLYELPLFGAGSHAPITLTLPPRAPSHADLAGIHLHRATLPEKHRTTTRDVPVTTVQRTLLDLARRRSFGASLVPMDAALHRHLVSRQELCDVLADCRGWPGSRRAQEIVDFADPRAESPLESLGRLSFYRHELPTPDLQHEITSPGGHHMEVDFWWEAYGVVAEADGLDKYTAPEILRQEKLRQERLERMGLRVVRFTWEDILSHSAETANRVRTAFRLNAGYATAS
jgi:hypothetical protein